jgi:hypothetical protein
MYIFKKNKKFVEIPDELNCDIYKKIIICTDIFLLSELDNDLHNELNDILCFDLKREINDFNNNIIIELNNKII